jgi:hypothetical protein
MSAANVWLLQIFPNLRNCPHRVTSPITEDYNCIAWAAGDTDNWWWPSPFDYWPVEPREATADGFIVAFRTLGYEPCADGNLEAGFEKVALYFNATGPTHMARQLVDGKWTSKLGKAWDIEHATLEGVGNGGYGAAVVFMKRPIIN